MPRKTSEKPPKIAPGEPRWWLHDNVLPDGTVSSTSYRIAWYEHGIRKRKNVATLEEAEALISAQKKKFLEASHSLVTQVTSLTKAQIDAAETAFRLLKTADYYDPKEPATAESLVKAINWFIESYPDQVDTIPTVKDAVEKFLATRTGMSVRTLNSHKGYLDAFCVKQGDSLVAAVQPQHIADFLKETSGEVARLHRWDTLHAFFEFCRGKKNIAGAWIGRNPVKQVPEPTYHPQKPKVYSVSEIKHHIIASIEHGYAPSVITRLFTMIRAEEMAAMVRNRGSIWKYANLETGWIELSAREVKTRADKKRGGRRIKIIPVMRQWLSVFKKEGWDIEENRTKDEKVRQTASPEKLGRGSGFTNLIRHSAISYRVTKEGSFSTVADEAGTSEVIIRESYYDRVTAKAARDVFALTPAMFTQQLNAAQKRAAESAGASQTNLEAPTP